VAEGYQCGNYRRVSMHVRESNRRRLGSEEVEYLSSLPLTRTFEFAGARFQAVHASLSDPLSGYLFPFADQDVWEAELALADCDFVLMGHTHWPWSHRFGGKTVMNPGSVGQPRDADPRASYAIWEDGRIRIERVQYPIEETVKELEAAGLDEQTVNLLSGILRRGG
jgi:predicted phosphodiesterase